ncbi:HlyD family efflux transporter periplasmic adaptor subunit [Microaerobacter geothermalis]|uniref:HlyD family secretion protein n=1 Tax=Microaerobacter geothermalis TaxID=674972 RepID=UPI001F2130A9|nr:HlyD family efflux transporter periplasmic adaptor subunit [Microaerobacter geothermalis]MCF6095053.1 HlyD family efflux transporter periplasmic adaptor subunit [Microaerobacter geothermalis]
MGKTRVIILLVILTIFTGGALILYQFQNEASAQQDQYISSGITEMKEIEVSFKIGGKLDTTLVQEGDVVKEGELLASLEDKDFQIKVDQAKANVEMAKALLEQSRLAVPLTKTDTEIQLKEAEAALKAAKAKYDALLNGARDEEKKQVEAKVSAAKEVYQVALDTYNKMEVLYQQGAIPSSKLDEAKVNLEKAKAEYDVSQQQLAMINKGARQEEIDGAKALVEQAEAAVERAKNAMGQVSVKIEDNQLAEAKLSQAEAALMEAETYLSYTKLFSPNDGMIITQSSYKGETVAAGKPVFTILDTSKVWARFYVSEQGLVDKKVGDKVTLYLDASKQKVEGKIILISPAADFAVKKATQEQGEADVRSFLVKVEIINPSPDLRSGYTVHWIQEES